MRAVISRFLNTNPNPRRSRLQSALRSRVLARRTMPVAGTPGWTGSLIVARRSFDRRSRLPMPRAEVRLYRPINEERRAKAARRSIAFPRPRPPLGGFTKECSHKKTPLSRAGSEGLCRFFGASPVASALGIRRARPRTDDINLNMPLGRTPANQDISTLPGLGRFYFALTREI